MLPEDYVFSYYYEIPYFVAPIAFLVSCTLFAFGFFPQKAEISLSDPKQIEAKLSALVKRRRSFSITGFLLFAGGVLFGAFTIVADFLG